MPLGLGLSVTRPAGGGLGALIASAVAAARAEDMLLWFGGLSLTGLYQDSAATTAGVVGQPVGRANDLQRGPANAALGASALGYPATQATAGFRPTLVQENGNLALAFDGTDDLLATTRTPGAAGTLIAAVKAPASLSSAICVVSAGGNNAAVAGAALRFSAGAVAQLQFSNGVSQSNIGLTTVSPNQRLVMAADWDGSGKRFFFNGALDGTGSAALTPTSALAYAVGAQRVDTPAQFFSGRVLLYAIASGKISDANRQAITRLAGALCGVATT